MSGERVRLKTDDAGIWWLSYRRYNRLHWINTGTTDKDEAEAMAAERERALVKEQTQKVMRRGDWGPPGLPAPAPPPAPLDDGGFNRPRIRDTKGGRP